jgi:hypothetical protein
MITELSESLESLPPGYWVDPATGAWCTIPWPTDPDERFSLASMSLGPEVINWAEGRTEEPGLTDYLTGQPWRYTPGQKRFLILWYLVDERGRFVYRSGVKRGAKGTGKDPFGASWCNAELAGPTQFSHFGDDGRPVGMRHGLPLVQIASNSEAQSKDVLRIANAMFGSLAREYYGIDTGETRTILKSGGRIELLTASEKSSEGDPATAIMLNESHHMTESNGGHKIAAVARRNVGKSPKILQARLVEFTNAHEQGMDSVGERSYEAFLMQQKTGAKRRDILYDSIEAPPTSNLYDDKSRMRALEAAYMDSPWSDLERLSDEVLDPRTTLSDSIRYYLNGLAAAESAWIEPGRFDVLADPSKVVSDGEQIAMFLDCSKSSDATGLVGCRLSDMHVFVLGVWQRPHGDRADGWLAPREEVDAIVRQAFDRFQVVWFGIDPSPAKDDSTENLYWQDLIDSIHRDFHEQVSVWATPGVKGGGGNSVLFDMRMSQSGGEERNKQFTEMAMATAQEIDYEDRPWTHDGNSVLRVHTHNARRRTNKWGISLGKITRDSNKLVDLAVCMVGARLGARIALNSGKVKPKRKKTGNAVFV